MIRPKKGFVKSEFAENGEKILKEEFRVRHLRSGTFGGILILSDENWGVLPMKKIASVLWTLPLVLAGCGAQEKTVTVWPIVLVVLAVAVGALALLRTRAWQAYNRRRAKKGRKDVPLDMLTMIAWGLAGVLLVVALLGGLLGGNSEKKPPDDEIGTSTADTTPQPHWEDTETGRKYILADGTVATGWQDIENKRYYFKEDGSTLAAGWQELEGQKLYFRADGSMARGEETVDGVKTFFTSTGAVVEVANPWNEIPSEYPIELMDLSNIYAVEGIQIDVKIYEPLKAMMDACNKAMAEQYGDKASKCCVTSGYRTMDDQIRLYTQEIKKWLDQDLTQDEAEKAAATAVAAPGTSEHQLGLAVDIVDTGSWKLDEFQADLPAQQWLINNSWEYGFILRYPEGKTDETGIIYEPWHYRYVGKELAKELHELNMTLEAYLNSLD